jgi:hypothetical protein
MIKEWLRGAFFVPSLLGAGIVGLLLVIGFETDWGNNTRPHTAPEKMAAARVADAGLLPAVTPSDIEQAYPESAARPLFLPARRPVPAAPPVQQQAVSTMIKGQFLLQGTSVAKDFGDVVLLREVATNKTHVVRKGGQINGKTIEKVEPSHIVLKQESETEELDMRTQGSPKNTQPTQSPHMPQGSIFPQPNVPGGPFPQQGMMPQPAPLMPPPAPIPDTAQAAKQAQASAQIGSFADNFVRMGVSPAAAQSAIPQPTPEEILARRRAARGQQTK